MYRNTYAIVNLDNIRNNVKKIINKCNGYKYYFGVVKADSYGHNDIKVVEEVIKGGCNYLCVATLDEALDIRKYNKDISILCLGIIDVKYIDLCIQNDITITICSYDYIEELINKNFKCHIKINTGMNRLGINNKEEFNRVINLIKNSNIYLEGIYTHMYKTSDMEITNRQIEVFKEITGDIDYSKIPIIHLGASEYTLNYPKLDFVNGCRLGIIMYGLVDNNLDLDSTFSLVSEVIQINIVNNATVGYEGNYKAVGEEKIAVIPIGYADGIIRKNTGRIVYINGKEYKIVGNICMDMLFVKIDDNIKVGDKVYIIRDKEHIRYIADYLDTIPYEVVCSISKRVPRKYVDNNN